MDKGTFRILLAFLGGALIIILLGAVYLLAANVEVPDWYTTMGASIVTGMLGLAVKSPSIEEVPVIQSNGNPAVPVVQVEGP